MKILHPVLERANVSVTPYHDAWTWTEAIQPAPDGSQNTCRITGFEAIVTQAAMLTADACGWHLSPLGELDERVRGSATVEDLVSWLRENADVLCRMLGNIKAIGEAGMGYGACSRSDATSNAITSIERLLLEGRTTDLETLRTALAQLVPRPVVAGFYAPGAAGPFGQFLMHLRERGLSYEEIALLIGELKPRERYKTLDTYMRSRKATADAIKHRINGQKGRLRRDFGDDGALGERCAAQNLPRQEWWVVLVSIRVEPFSEVTIRI